MEKAKVDFNLDLYGLSHIAQLVVDIRTETTEPLIKADYKLKNLEFEIPAETFGAYPGVPAFDTGCDMDMLLNIYEDEGFDISGMAYFNNLKILISVKRDVELSIGCKITGKHICSCKTSLIAGNSLELRIPKCNNF